LGTAEPGCRRLGLLLQQTLNVRGVASVLGDLASLAAGPDSVQNVLADRRRRLTVRGALRRCLEVRHKGTQRACICFHFGHGCSPSKKTAARRGMRAGSVIRVVGPHVPTLLTELLLLNVDPDLGQIRPGKIPGKKSRHQYRLNQVRKRTADSLTDVKLFLEKRSGIIVFPAA